MSGDDASNWPSYAERVDTETLKGFFDDEGYVRLDNFLTSDEICGINLRLQDYRDKVIPVIPSKFVFYENKSDENSIVRLERMLWHDDFFKALAESPAFNGLADILLGVPCRPDNVQWFSKPPGAKPTPPHQVSYTIRAKNIGRRRRHRP